MENMVWTTWGYLREDDEVAEYMYDFGNDTDEIDWLDY